MEKQNLWQIYEDAEIQKLEEVNKCYRECLDEGKTERECVTRTIHMAKKAGYRDFRQITGEKIKDPSALHPWYCSERKWRKGGGSGRRRS